MDSKISYLLGNTEKWKCGDKSLIYVTPFQISQKIAEIANKFYDLQKMVVVDMYAGIGMDSCSLAKYASVVYAVENDIEIYLNLCENIKNNVNVIPILQDSFKYVTNNHIKADLVYFDPPWGEYYRSGEKFDFNDVIIEDLSIVNIAQNLHEKYGNMIIKSPYSSDTFENLFKDKIKYRFCFPRQHLKFLFIFRDYVCD